MGKLPIWILVLMSLGVMFILKMPFEPSIIPVDKVVAPTRGVTVSLSLSTRLAA